MMIGCMRYDQQGQTQTIDNRNDFDTFTAFGMTTLQATATSIGKGRITLRSESNRAKNVLPDPLLESAIHYFIVRKALREDMPLGSHVFKIVKTALSISRAGTCLCPERSSQNLYFPESDA